MCRLRSWPVPILLLAALATHAGAAPPNVPVNDPAGDPLNWRQVGPRIAALDNLCMVVWTETTGSNRFQYAYSTDGGAHYVDGGVPPAPAGWNWRLDPRVAFDAAGGRVLLGGQITGGGHWGIGFLTGEFIGGMLVFGTPVVVEDLLLGSSVTIGAVDIGADPAGRYYVVYSTFPASPDHTYLRTSDDGGATWSAPIQIDDGAVPGSGEPKLSITTGEDVRVTWVEIDAASIWFRARVWPHGSPGFGPIATWMAVPFPAITWMPPGAADEGDIGSLGAYELAIDCSVGPHRDRTYAVWAQAFDVSGVAFPATTDPGLYHFVESEPNDTSLTVPFDVDPGTIFRGTVGAVSPPDADWYAVKLTAGTRLVVWADSLAPSTYYDLRVIAPDQVSRLTGVRRTSDSFGLSSVYDRLGFVAPADGVYYLRYAPVTSAYPAGSGYRIRSWTAPPAAGPRDTRDVYATWSDDGFTWAVPVRVNLDPIGFDDYQPAVAVGNDGMPYVAWYDYSDPLGGPGRSRRVVARSTDGGATWTPAQALSDVLTDWTSVVAAPQASKMGFESGLASSLISIEAAWTDGRLGDPDVYAAGFPTGSFLAGCPTGPIQIAPGDTYVASVASTNLNTLFGNVLTISATTDRGWPEPVIETSLGAGASLETHVHIDVPDTAADGDVVVCIRKTVQGADPTECCFTLQVGLAAGVAGSGAPRLGLRASPNPALAATRLVFRLPHAEHARLAIFDLAGKQVRTIADDDLAAGIHERAWDLRDDAGHPAPVGEYFARLSSPEGVVQRRIVRLR